MTGVAEGARVFFTDWDFGYMPPLPIEAEWLPAPQPSSPAPHETLAEYLYYVNDAERIKQLRAGGEYVSVVDFWLEAERPDDKDIVVYETYTEIASRWKLMGPWLVFGAVCSGLALRDANISWSQFRAKDEVELPEAYHVYKRAVLESSGVENFLIARQYLMAIHERSMPLPYTLSPSARDLLGRVALSWHEAAPCKPAGEAHHYTGACCEPWLDKAPR